MYISSYLQQYYKKKVLFELKEKYRLSNVHEVPKLKKIVINSGLKANIDKNNKEEVRSVISEITGQHAVITRATKSISNFKLRKGMPVGVKVTLRGRRMYDFLYRLVAIALPNIRDFNGLPEKLDGRGNYTLGIEESTIFPEINTKSNIMPNVGMSITIVTTASKDLYARSLLQSLGMPFKKIN